MRIKKKKRKKANLINFVTNVQNAMKCNSVIASSLLISIMELLTDLQHSCASKNHKKKTAG